MTGRLPAWLADWLGVELPATGDAATWQLDSAWHWPPWATVLLVLAAILWTVMLYTREASTAGRGYRALLTACGWRRSRWCSSCSPSGRSRCGSPARRVRAGDRPLGQHGHRRPLRPIPSSPRSFAERLSEDRPHRTDAAQSRQTAGHRKRRPAAAELARRYRLEVYFAAGGIERQPRAADAAEWIAAIRALTADGPDSHATRLGDAVRHVLDDFRGAPPAAILLLTDGVTTDGLPLADAAQEARQKGVPLLAVGLGRGEPPRDIEVADVLVDDAVFVNDLVSFQIQIKATGLEGQPAEVILRREDGASGATGSASAVANKPSRCRQPGETLTVQLVDRPTSRRRAVRRRNRAARR